MTPLLYAGSHDIFINELHLRECRVSSTNTKSHKTTDCTNCICAILRDQQAVIINGQIEMKQTDWR